jgi:hypothetical protein
MKRLYKSGVARLAALVAVAALAGCSGGAGTEQNPVTTGPNTGPTYVGPAPATADIQSFRVEFWENVRGTDRCGNCHNAGGQAPTFARSDDVNAAYQQASGVVDRNSPSQSRIVTKVAGGHNCWLADAGACANILTRWITDWVGATNGGGRQIELIEPDPVDPGSSRRFPANQAAAAFGQLYGLLTAHCDDCHKSNSATAQSPFFAADNIDEAYLAATPKINLDDPAQSRFVIRLGRESHNCWSGDCAADAAALQAAIQQMTDAIDPSEVSPLLVTSKALTLYDGTIAAGGNRYDNNVIALYEFQTGQGNIAFDTSGVDPAADLTISGARVTDWDWVGGWGVNFKTAMSKAQASTGASRKFHQLITATGEYSVEAWVVPGNVTQEDARIVSYSGSATTRNFMLGQTLYNYDTYNRSTATDSNGAPAFSTPDADERLQASLQHVVMTFDPVNGRRIYVNGEFTGGVDGAGGGTLGDWDNSFAFVLGNEVSNNRPWAGVVRLVAVHNRALNAAQVRQNFEAGVGEKFFLLFGISHIVNVPKAYIVFEVTQYDSSGYLFTNPKFLSLDAAAMPGTIPLEGMRIGVNGAEPQVGQAYRLLTTVVSDANYSAATGQTLSTVGTIIPVELGAESDEFFLCFDKLGPRANPCSNFAEGVPVNTQDNSPYSAIGVRTFDSINASMAAITGVDPNTTNVKTVFTNVRQSLPAVEDLAAFLASHQASIAQLAIAYCDALVKDNVKRAAFFPALDFGAPMNSQPQYDALINPLVEKAIGTNLSTQPGNAGAQLQTLITNKLCSAGACASAARTPTVSTAVCGAALGGATMLVR